MSEMSYEFGIIKQTYQMMSEDIKKKKKNITSISQRERKELEFKQSTEVTDYVSVQALSLA